MIYTFAIIFATWGVVYHYIGLARKAADPRLLGARLAAVQGARGHSQPRSHCARWRQRTSSLRRSSRAAPDCAGGCTSCCSGAACWRSPITFPLVFGWIHFTSAPNDQMTYVTHLFGFRLVSFRLHTFTALTALSWTGYLGGAGAGAASRFRCGAGCATRAHARCRPSAMDFLPLDPALRDFGHRPGADGFAGCGCAAASTAFSRSCTPSR